MDYENAVIAYNTLQGVNAIVTPQQYLQRAELARKYLLRADITLEDIDQLSVIHVTGTKGKGSTCALTESILRQHGYRTGLFSSPHLLEIRERISINGLPISKQDFATHFWEIYKILDERRESEIDIPRPFTLMLIIAFRIFLLEKVDVAIIEVGVGGEYDATNILRKVPVVGITSLGLDHVSLLGNTIEEIAWHKSGIMKPESRVYTVPQVPSAISVFKKRSIERNCLLFEVVEPLHNLSVVHCNYPKDIFNLNSNLAVSLSQAWINYNTKLENIDAPEIDILMFEETFLGLSRFTWPGRYEVIQTDKHTFYIDGAHTHESIKICAAWFNKMTYMSQYKKALIFNTTGDRNSKDLLQLLVNCDFNKVFFVPNRAIADNNTEDEQITRCHDHHLIWTNCNTYSESVQVLPSVTDALNECPLNYNILITGSLYLVGAALKILGDGGIKTT